MVAYRKAMESIWHDRCAVTVRVKHTNPDNKRTEFEEQTVLSDVPCKLSFETLNAAGDGMTAGTTQGVKLFTSLDVQMPTGSRITVTRGGALLGIYARSGEPGRFLAHQEIPLELFKEWA